MKNLKNNKAKNRLFLRDGDDFALLSVKGYESEDVSSELDTWFYLYGHIRVQGDSLRGSDPCLQTEDILNLRAYFNMLKEGEIDKIFYCVMEQNLYFNCSAEHKFLEIYFFPERTMCRTFANYSEVCDYQYAKQHVIFRKRLCEGDINKIIAWLNAVMEEFPLSISARMEIGKMIRAEKKAAKAKAQKNKRVKRENLLYT